MRAGTVTKAIEAGIGVVIIGTLEVLATDPTMEAWLTQVVPAQLVPLVPVVLGGAWLTVRVYRGVNSPQVSADPLTVDVPAPADPADGALTPGPAPAPAAPGIAPLAVQSAAPDAAGVAASSQAAAAIVATDGPVTAAAAIVPALPELRDAGQEAAYRASLESYRAALEDTTPPTAFIALPVVN